MGLDVKVTVETMLGAMKPILGARWDSVSKYAAGELEKLAKTLAQIELQKLRGSITEQQANILFDMQKNASSAVLAALQGIGADAANQALNAGLASIKGDINKSLGFKLL